MSYYQGKKKISVRCIVCLLLLSASQMVWAIEEEASPLATTIEKSSILKKTLQALRSYTEVNQQLQETRKTNQMAITHHRMLSDNLNMAVSENVFQQVKGFRKYSKVSLNEKMRLGFDTMKASPLGPKETRILKNMPHFTTLQDSQSESDRGLGIEFTYQFD